MRSDTSHGRRPLALLADDDREMRALLSDTLREEGWEVLEAVDGFELATRVRALVALDLIISDMRMPGLTGLEAIEELRKGACRVPVILLSGFADASLEEEAARLGIAAVLPKPFPLRTLLEAVRRAAEAPRI